MRLRACHHTELQRGHGHFSKWFWDGKQSAIPPGLQECSDCSQDSSHTRNRDASNQTSASREGRGRRLIINERRILIINYQDDAFIPVKLKSNWFPSLSFIFWKHKQHTLVSPGVPTLSRGPGAAEFWDVHLEVLLAQSLCPPAHPQCCCLGLSSSTSLSQPSLPHPNISNSFKALSPQSQFSKVLGISISTTSASQPKIPEQACCKSIPPA